MMGLLFGLAAILSTLEHSLPPVPLLPPGVKLGLANIAVMYCVFFIGNKQAFTLNILKSVFVLLVRGPLAGSLSFTGGILSVCIIVLLLKAFDRKISYIAVSSAGAVSHNIGQLAVCALILRTAGVVYYLPLLLIAGIATGAVTGVLLKALLPALRKTQQVLF